LRRFNRPLKVAIETNTVTTDICEACGVEARPDTLFCYNCGESLERNDAAPQLKPVDRPEITSNGSPKAAPEIKEGPGLPSAASIQKQSKSFRNKPIQITWEPIEDSSDGLLIAVSVGLFIIAMLIVGIVVYFK
jgi:hypothetical protein